MTNIEKKTDPISNGLLYVMKKEGFIKKGGNNWYYHNDETIFVVNLQSEDNVFKFINFAIWVKNLADEKYLFRLKKYNVNPDYPKENHCHIRFRLRAALPEELWEICHKLTNVANKDFSYEKKLEMVVKFIEHYGIPLLKQCSTIDGIIKALKEKKFKSAAVRKEVEKLLN